MFLFCAVFCFGCKFQTNDKSTVAMTQDSKSPSDTVVSREPKPEDETEWQETGSVGTIGEQTEFESGDLVPCPKDMATFSLDIEAIKNGDVYYRFSQPFCFYKNGEFNPANQHGMSTLNIKLATLVGGSLAGNHFYTKLTSESATIRVDWAITNEHDSETFSGEFKAVRDRNGHVDLGVDRKLKWSFKPVLDD